MIQFKTRFGERIKTNFIFYSSAKVNFDKNLEIFLVYIFVPT